MKTEPDVNNEARLHHCRRHVFRIPVAGETLLAQTWRCTACQGEVTTDQKQWYETGLVHAAR